MSFNPQLNRKLEVAVDFNTPKASKVRSETPGKPNVKMQGRTVQQRKQVPGDENITSNFNKVQKAPQTPVQTTPLGGRPRARSSEVIEVASTVKLQGRDTGRVESLNFLINGGDVGLTDDELRINIAQLESDLKTFCTKNKSERNQTDLTYYNKYYETALLDSYRKILAERELKKFKLENINANFTIDNLKNELEELKGELEAVNSKLDQEKNKSVNANKELLDKIQKLNEQIANYDNQYFKAVNTVKACRKQEAKDKVKIEQLNADKTVQAETIESLVNQLALEKMNVKRERTEVQTITAANKNLADENAKLRTMLQMFHNLAAQQVADLSGTPE